jgi:hypothetical protein
MHRGILEWHLARPSRLDSASISILSTRNLTASVSVTPKSYVKTTGFRNPAIAQAVSQEQASDGRARSIRLLI